MAIDFPSQLGRTIWEYDFFSGSQTLVYFEDVLVDDIVRIAWGVTQNRQPVYGYASQYYSGLAAGTVIGGGSFWIDFKEAYYIPGILAHIAQDREGTDDGFGSPAVSSTGASPVGLAESAASWEGENVSGNVRATDRTTRENIERIVSLATNNSDDSEVQSSLYRYVARMAAMNDRDFENNAEFFEDAVWYAGNRANGRSGRQQATSGNLSPGNMVTEDILLSHRRADQYPSFDMLVTFGDINNAAANHSVIRLTDVTITDTKFVGIEDTGEPIAVQYDFLFRNQM